MGRVIKRRWTPHETQRAIMNDDARFRIVACGRRFGKTTMALHEGFEAGIADPGSLVWFVFPTFNDALELGYERMLQLIPRSLIESKTRASPPTIKLTQGTTYSFRSADREDSLRGRGVDTLVIDEAGSVADRAWQNELRPSLSDTLGTLLAIGTPKGRDWFYKWYKRGDDDEHPQVHSFHATSYDNPHIPDSEIEDARNELPERVFEQEYLAKFVDTEGAVFGDVWDRNAVSLSLDDREQFAGPYTVGVDLARTQNFSVAVALDAAGTVSGFWRGNKTSWDAIQRHVERVARENQPCIVRLDATRDNKVVQDIEASGFQVEPVNFGASNKRDMVENLAARLETRDVLIPDSLEVLLNELEMYEYDATPSGNVRYGAPAGEHDDCVDALALAARKPERKKTAGAWGR